MANSGEACARRGKKGDLGGESLPCSTKMAKSKRTGGAVDGIVDGSAKRVGRSRCGRGVRGGEYARCGRVVSEAQTGFSFLHTKQQDMMNL